MEEPTDNRLWKDADPINGRKIRAFNHGGRWRWFVQAQGPKCPPPFEETYLSIMTFAGDTLGEAQSLATQLGPLATAEDETAKIESLSKQATPHFKLGH
jgi:hypothetical protein